MALYHYKFEFYGGYFYKSKWHKYQDETHKIPYWYNVETEISSWDDPEMVLDAMIENRVKQDIENTVT